MLFDNLVRYSGVAQSVGGIPLLTVRINFPLRVRIAPPEQILTYGILICMPFKNHQDLLAYQRKWMADRRHSFFHDKSCVECGSTHELELDHIDPGQKVDHRIWNWSKERQEVELAKCQVLCESCHLIKTKKWYELRRKHGSHTMYTRGCRCVECKANEVRRVNDRRRKRLIAKSTTKPL